jgi:hypothetical protein
MVHTSKKPAEELLSILDGLDRLFVVACGGCPVGGETGTEADVTSLSEALAGSGKTIAGRVSIDFLCNKILAGTRLMRHAEELRGVDAVLVSSCGIGVQAIAKLLDVPAIPALDTVSLDGLQGLYPASEYCAECGDCVLHLTGGICPISGCAKQLLNGPCGGSQNGMCEVDPENRKCAWEKIVKRMEELGRLHILEQPISGKDWKLPVLDARKY